MNEEKIFQPKIISALKGYNRDQLVKDIMAGLVVAIIAIPLSIAFGISSGVSPAQGLITAVVAGFIISAIGGSRIQIGGPTGAFIVIVYSIVIKYGVEGLIIATLMGGVMLVAFGLLRFGSIIRYVPESIIAGFTAGIAVIIFSSQLKEMLGLSGPPLPAEFLHKIQVILERLHDVNFQSLVLTVVTVISLLVMRRLIPKIPGAFVVLIIGSMAVMLLGLQVSTIGSVYGKVGLSIEPFNFSRLSLDTIFQLLPAAFSIAFLGAIESLLSAVVADAMIGGKHRPNTELIAQGIANIASSLVGGIPATGAIARTAANARSGAKTPVAGMSHALFLLIIMVLFADLTASIPMAVLAGILMYVAIGMAGTREFIAVAKSGKTEAIILFATFFLTVFIDLVVAIGAGLVLAAFFFIRHTAENSAVKAHEPDESEKDIDLYYFRPDALSKLILPAHVRVLELSGTFFFGAAMHFEQVLRDAIGKHHVVILRFARLSQVDGSGIRVLSRIIHDAGKLGTKVVFCEVTQSVLQTLESGKLLDKVPREHVNKSIAETVKAFTDGTS